MQLLRRNDCMERFVAMIRQVLKPHGFAVDIDFCKNIHDRLPYNLTKDAARDVVLLGNFVPNEYVSVYGWFVGYLDYVGDVATSENESD